MFVVTKVTTTKLTFVHNDLKMEFGQKLLHNYSLGNYFQMAKFFFKPFESYSFGNKGPSPK